MWIEYVSVGKCLFMEPSAHSSESSCSSRWIFSIQLFKVTGRLSVQPHLTNHHDHKREGMIEMATDHILTIWSEHLPEVHVCLLRESQRNLPWVSMQKPSSHRPMKGLDLWPAKKMALSVILVKLRGHRSFILSLLPRTASCCNSVLEMTSSHR